MISLANTRWTLDHHVRFDNTIRADFDIGANQGPRAYFNRFMNSGTGMDYGAIVYHVSTVSAQNRTRRRQLVVDPGFYFKFPNAPALTDDLGEELHLVAWNTGSFEA